MNIEEFSQLLDAYGTDLETWPDPLAAREFLQRTPEASIHFDAAVAVERVLVSSSIKAPLSLAPRILENLPDQHALRESMWHELLSWLPTKHRWVPVASALLPLFLGFALGLNGIQETSDITEDDYLWVFADNLEQSTVELLTQSAFLDEEENTP